jgi:hypothetical protein
MRIVIGEVSEKEGVYKMRRGIHLDIEDDATLPDVWEALKGAAKQLLTWREEASTVGEITWQPPSTTPN